MMTGGVIFDQYVSGIVKGKAGGVAVSVLRSTVNRDASFMIPIFTTNVRPLLEYASTVGSVGYSVNVRQWHEIQIRWTRHIFMGEKD